MTGEPGGSSDRRGSNARHNNVRLGHPAATIQMGIEGKFLQPALFTDPVHAGYISRNFIDRSKKPPWFPGTALIGNAEDYFFFAARFSMIAAWAAARRATGTR